MTKESANNLNKISIPDKDWFGGSDGKKLEKMILILYSFHFIK